ncbi:MAG: RNA 2'-phosphotransferase [Atribacterota bacterium]
MDKVAVSKYMSYLLRHNPENLDISKNGYVPISQLLSKLRRRYPEVDRRFLEKVVKHGHKRFQIKNDQIRALYGHSIPVKITFKNEIKVDTLYHGTTENAAKKIMQQGLNPQSRNKVHLSISKEEAERVGTRRTSKPVILKIDVKNAVKNGISFYKATDKVYLSNSIPPRFISRTKN